MRGRRRAHPRWWPVLLLAPLAVLTALAVGPAAAFWAGLGTGAGAAGTATTHPPLTIAPGVPTALLMPGGVGDVALTLTNPGTVQGRVQRLELATDQGTGGFAVDAGHTACGTASLSFTAQTNGGTGWTVPAGGSLAVVLTGSIALATNAPNACQGAAVTVYLRAAR